MHYENPGFTAQDVFDDDEIQAMVQTKWMDILRKQYFHLAVRPWLLNSPGGQRGKGKKIHKMAVFVWCTVTKIWQQRRFERSKNCEKQFRHQTQLCLSASKHWDGDTMAYYQNWRSPWFERLTKARRSLEEREENRLQGENIHRPNTKWSFEYNLIV